MDAELEFAIQPSTTGKQLFDQVLRQLHQIMFVYLLHWCYVMLTITRLVYYSHSVLGGENYWS